MIKGLLVMLSFCTVGVYSQTSAGIETKRFYDALNRGDSLAMSAMLSKDLLVTHYESDTTYSFTYEQFMGICSKFRTGYFREDFKITHETGYPGTDIVDVLFAFYLDGTHHHCGKDVVIWNEGENNSVPPTIIEIHSYTHECNDERNPLQMNRSQITSELNQLMDAWHNAAAKANFDAYFGFMADDFYYLGTDPAERWSKEQFANFSRPHFDKGEAWSFTATERNFYFSDDLSVIWFDEKLETWMEGCRGSGVIVLEPFSNGETAWGNWKLKHYNLTVTIENEKIKDFIKLRKQ